MLRYLGEHFRGQQSLALSFWVNFITPASALGFAGAMLADIVAADSRYLGAFLAFIIANTAIYSWQVSGVWRATERALQEHAWFFWARGAQVVVVLSVLVILEQYLMFAFLAVVDDPKQTEHSNAGGYTLNLSPDGTVVELSGRIDFGVTQDLTQLLADHRSISMVSLDSSGGLVAEARGLAKVIARHRLNTYAAQTCSSACTHVYISGERRFLGSQAKLGFHSYLLDAPYAGLFMDPAVEHRRDMALFHEQGVDSGFIERVLETPHEKIWFPSHQELLDAGITHEVRELQ